MDFQSLLLDAVVKGDESTVFHVLALGGNVNGPDASGLTALHWASVSSDAETLVPMLLARGAKINARDTNGVTPLHLHAAQGRCFGVACLLHQGADPNLQTNDTLSTPLHFAAFHKQANVARLLLAYGAKTGLVNSRGQRAKDLGLANLTM